MTRTDDTPVVILGIDPSAESPGYAVYDAWYKRHMYVGRVCPTNIAVDAIVVESGFIGRMGLKASWGLGFDAGWRLCEALTLLNAAGSFNLERNIYTIRPDGASGWRAALPARLGAHQKFDGLPKPVIVARLRARYRNEAVPLEETTDDMIEACGIAEAAAAILQRPKAKDRKALKPVRRGDR